MNERKKPQESGLTWYHVCPDFKLLKMTNVVDPI